MNENELSKVVLDVAFKIHKELGPGLFESVYEAIMAYELMKEYEFECPQAKTNSRDLERCKTGTWV